jgi:hypothetical protein
MKFLSDIDICGNRLLSCTLENVPRLPDGRPVASIVYDEEAKKPACFDGEKWIHLSETDLTMVNVIIGALKGIKFGHYEAGKPGRGGAVLIDQDGSSRADVDYLNVRKVANFQHLLLQETKHVGGRMILSSAAMMCSRVEETASSYKCFFETTDGNGNRVYNQFEAGDQAIRQTFNLSGSVYYWRLVVATGEDYIELSKTDCDEGSGAPQAGDEIVQLGNRDNKTRQSAQILSAYGSGSPSYEVFNGINSYSLAGKNIAGIVYYADTGEPQTYCYGDSYTGDRDIDDPDATFMTFQKKDGEERKKLHVQAEITLGAGSSGLSNLSEWAGKQQEIDDAKDIASNAEGNAKNEVAKGIGYASWAEMEDALKGGQTIIQDGYINTQLIKAKAISAAMIAVEDLFAQTISAKAMTLEEGCYIGGFAIRNNNGFGTIQAGNPFNGTGMLLDKNMIGYYSDRLKTTERKAEFGSVMRGAPYCVINSVSKGSSNIKNIALQLGATGATWFHENPDKSNASVNFALACPTGMIGGARPMLRNGVDGETLSALDHTIIVTKSMTLYLPKNPEIGQRYEFVKDATGILVIQGNGKDIWEFGASASSSNRFDTSFKGRGYVEYEGSYWILTYSKL